MTELQQKRLNFLNETIEYYKTHSRSVDINREMCVYYLNENTGCAIGRHIVDKELCKYFDSQPHYNAVDSDEVFFRLPNQLKELGQNFLYEVQKLHDISIYWKGSYDLPEGLSDIGEEKVRQIKIKFIGQEN